MIKSIALSIVDLFISPLVFLSSALLWLIRRAGIRRMPISRSIFRFIGVFPIRDHYYEPLFQNSKLTQPLSAERHLPGVNLCYGLQVDTLKSMNYRDELLKIPRKKRIDAKREFYFDNHSFGPGDSDFLYCIVRKFRPRRIIEIGSGMSTLMARRAIEANMLEEEGYSCHHRCIEPYEAPWLAEVGVEVCRSVAEALPLGDFEVLEANDLLFIDSSHMIRPQGDVLFEFLEILPTLKQGVIVHVHDIFTPCDYPDQWISNDVLFWNEQYLLEAFLTLNREFEIVGALNWLRHHHFELFQSKCAYLDETHEPGSFYMRRK